MAIAFDSSSNNIWWTGSTNTIAHTCSGTNRILWVSAFMGVWGDVITWVTYNGVAMTRASIVIWDTDSIYMYYLIAPATGANNIVVSKSNTSDCYVQSTSYTGVKQSWQPDATGTSAFATRTNLSTSVTTVIDNCWLVGIFRTWTTQTAVAGTTLRAWVNATLQIWDSNGAKTPAGSYSLWTTFSSSSSAQIVCSFSPFSATANTTNFFQFLT